MPTPHQRRLIRTLQGLHAAGEPLNITAVKRRHPELLKAVMAVTPYWGWKRALEAAGIAYSRIKVELLDGIECALCGKWWRNLATHLIRKHQVRPDEYRMDYPDSDLVCEELRARQLRKDSASIPHWEPVWSREYALDRLAEYRRRGIPLHSATLHCALTHYVGGRKPALLCIGLDPTIRHPQSYKYKSREAVLAAIRKRANRNLPLSSGLLRERPFADVSLLHRAVWYFGSWPNALRVAGFDPSKARAETVSKMRRYPDAAAAHAAIRQRQRNGRPLNRVSLVKGRFREHALCNAAIRHFGSWDAALRAAGFNPVEIRPEALRKRRRYPDAAAALAGLQQRHRKGQPMNVFNITRGRFVDAALYLAAKRHFGSWDNVLRAAGFDPIAIHAEVHRKRWRYPDKASVLAAIRQRQKAGRPLNYTRAVSGKYRNPILTVRAKHFFGSWNNALRAAGIDPIEVREKLFRKRRRYPDKAAVLAGLQQRQRKNRPLNVGGVFEGRFRDQCLYLEAKRYFGSWDNALRAAGFDPDAIRLVKRKDKNRHGSTVHG